MFAWASLLNLPPRCYAMACAASWLLVHAAASPALAQERFAGQWVVAGAVAAPWASDPKDAADESNVILEVRAGTGGDEAALFAGDLFRMYVKYAEARSWKVDVLSLSEGTAGGYKEIIAEIARRGAYARLKPR